MANPQRSRSPSTPNQPLVFVNLSNPAAVESESIRRLVRSSATRHSHKDPDRKPKSRRAPRSRHASNKASSPNISASSSRADSPSGDETHTTESSVGALFSVEERAAILAFVERPRGLTSDHERRSQHSPSPTEPNNSYPVESEEWFPWVLSYYKTTYLPTGVSLLQQSPAEGEEFIDWFLREGSTEPALFYMQLLSTCAPLLNEKRLRKDHIEWLRGMVVQSINNAISDSTRASRPATLLAVVLLALHEHVYGDSPAAASIHSRAFARMLEIRGGTRTLELPRIMWAVLLWLERILTSTDNLDDTSKQLMAGWLPPYRTT